MGFNSGFKGLRNIGIINSTTRLHLVGSFYEFYITMYGSMNIKLDTFPFRWGREFRNLQCWAYDTEPDSLTGITHISSKSLTPFHTWMRTETQSLKRRVLKAQRLWTVCTLSSKFITSALLLEHLTVICIRKCTCIATIECSSNKGNAVLH